MTDLAPRLEAAAAAVEAALLARIARLGDTEVSKAMAHAAAGGKRLRAFLVLESAALHHVQGAMPAAEAIEAMHAYSLVHDDLPAMDDDDLRRGRPTVHRKWDEATAILTGDALQALAFEAISETGSVPLIRGLARAAGASGMVLGQARDIAAETAAGLGVEDVTLTQRLKTGALFEWAATAGPVMAGDDPGPLAAYAEAVGLAFQIADDVLDVAGDAARAGKAVGKDAERGKATFVSLLGLDAARARAEALAREAEAALAPYGERGATLKALARFVIARSS